MEYLPNQNLLLAALPRPAYDRIVPQLQPAEFAQGRTLVPPAGQADRFFFITSGVVSVLYETEKGESAEIAMVGAEGAIGLPLVLADRPFPAFAMVQVDCTAWSLPASLLRSEFEHGYALQRNLLQFTQALMTQIAHTAICYRHHSVRAQLIRWLLLCLDRLHTEEIRMTQQTIAQMLGVRRAGVTEAVAELVEQGVITRRRGALTVTDRAGLEAMACECYRVVANEYTLYEQTLHTHQDQGATGA